MGDEVLGHRRLIDRPEICSGNLKVDRSSRLSGPRRGFDMTEPDGNGDGKEKERTSRREEGSPSGRTSANTR